MAFLLGVNSWQAAITQGMYGLSSQVRAFHVAGKKLLGFSGEKQSIVT